MSEIWKDAIEIWKKEIFKGGSCAICGFSLEEVFPEDFPDDWKFCCSCLAWANYLTKLCPRISPEEMMMLIKNSPTVSKINDKITLIKGEE